MSDEIPSQPSSGTSRSGFGSASSKSWEAPTLDAMQGMLPQYQFISLLGRGGMGAVYKAVQLSLDRTVAVKILASELIDDAEANFVERFKNEARTMARMNHPGIVNVYDFGEVPGGLLYIVMEFVDGTDVAQMVKSQGKLPPEYAHAITAHVSDALQYAHSQGIIHRDIKPANVLINHEGQIKVADFGLAKATDISGNTSGLTKTNMTMGTPDYVAPEALMIGVLADHRADLYAVGVMLYNMLTGEIPRGIFKMPSQKLGSDPRFDSIIAKAMETDREERYQSASDIRRDLDAILTTPKAKIQQQSAPQGGGRKPMAQRPGAMGGSTGAVPPYRAPELLQVSQKKSDNSKLMAIIGAVAVLGLGAFFVFKKPAPPSNESTPVAMETSIPEPVAYVPRDSPKPEAKEPTMPSPPPRGIARQTLDLLALTDPVKDRIPVPSMVMKNEWVREDTALIYKSDGKSGKLAAPVAFNCRDYEIELRAERLSGSDRIHFDVPLTNGRILPLVLNSPGRKIINEREGQPWGASSSAFHVTVRVMLGKDGAPDRVVIQSKDSNETITDWTGSLDKFCKTGEDHPGFPKQPVASIFVMKDPYAIKIWTLRVFEGEAKVLRGEGSTPTTPPTIADGSWAGWKGPGNVAAESSWQLYGTAISTTQRTTLWSAEAFGDCELELEWKMGPRGNGGVFYLVFGESERGSPEMQLCDPANAGDGGRTGALYGLIPEKRDASKPLGEWNSAKLVISGSKREHWINGELVCNYDVTQFRSRPGFDVTSGKFVLQANAGKVSYRNLKVRRLDASAPAVTLATATPVMPVVPKAPVALPSSDPRITQLEAGFKARYETDAQKPFLAALTSLNQSYVANGISSARAAAQKKGALDEITALDAEKGRIQNNEPLPPADLETLPASLKTLRNTYRNALAKLETDRALKAAPLYDLYLGALDAYIAELTKGNKIDEAQKVKTLRDDVAAQKPQADAGAATLQSATPAITEINKPSTKPAHTEGEESALSRSRWYEAARWVLSVGGEVIVEKNGQFIGVRTETDIPAGRFVIVRATINSNPKSQGIRDDDFTRFSGLKELSDLKLINIKVTDAAFAFLPTTPALTKLIFSNVPATDALLTHLAPLQKLTELNFQNVRQFTGTGLEKLASLPFLKIIWFTSTGFNDAGIRALAGARSLDYINLADTQVTDEGIASLAAHTNLTGISLQRCRSVRGTTLAGWGSMASLKNLDMGGCSLGTEAFPAIGKFINLTKLELEACTTLNDETLPALAPLTKLTSINIARSHVTGIGFTALRGWTELRELKANQDTPISAAGLAAIVATFPKLESLSLGSSAQLEIMDFRSLAGLKALKFLDVSLPTLDDAVLAEIAHITSLESFYAQGSAITSKGIAAFKSLKFLTRLRISNCKNIDDTAIPALKDLKWLKELSIQGTAITEEGATALKKALPGCNVGR